MVELVNGVDKLTTKKTNKNTVDELTHKQIDKQKIVDEQMDRQKDGQTEFAYFTIDHSGLRNWF